MAIADVTKPMALDETLQGTNTALGLLAKDTTVASIVTALALLGKDTSIQAVVTALGLLNKDATMVTQNSKLDTIIAKLQGIIEALGVDTSIYKAAGNKACADLTPSLLVAGNLGNVYNITDNGTTTVDFVEGAGKPIHLGDNVAVVDIGEGGSHVYKFDLLSGLVDLSNYIQKSETAGLVKNDGTIDETPYTVVEASETNGNIVIDDVETPVYRNYGNNTVLQTDKTPFLTRQTLNPTGFSGYVREKLIGVSYAWNQLVQNGNFASTSNWTVSSGTFTVSGNIGSLVGAGYVYQSVSMIQGHTYLVTIKSKTTNTSETTSRLYYGTAYSYINITVSGANAWNTVQYILVCTGTLNRLDLYASTGVTNNYADLQVTDLTLAFGSTIADYLYGLSNNGGITKLRDMGCPIDKYTPYGYGLYSVKTSGKKIVGFNQWDEVWEQGDYNNAGQKTTGDGIRSANKIKIKKGASYYLKGTTFWICEYDDNETFIRRYAVYTNNVVTFENNVGYITFNSASAYGSTYNHDICINYPSTETSYHPYSSTTYPLGNDELRGKFDLVNGEIVASGDVKESNGGITRNWKLLDLGTLTYQYSNGWMYSNAPSDSGAVVGGGLATVCERYVSYQSTLSSAPDKSVVLNHGGFSSVKVLAIKDSAYTDPTVFKTAMNGVYLLYPLATPTTEQSTPFADPMSLVGATTEEYIDTRDIPCPVGAERQYMGQSEDIVEIPSMPLSDGDSILHCNKSGNQAQMYWSAGEPEKKTASPLRLEQTYTSASNLFVVPEDGYIFCFADNVNSQAVWYFTDESGTIQNYIVTFPMAYASLGIFVKKGVTGYANYNGAAGVVYRKLEDK